MSDDELDRDGTKDTPTRVTGTGKELLGWLKPGSSTGSSEEQSAERSDRAGSTLDRRSYMMLASGAAAAAVGGVSSGAVASTTGTTIRQPDVYGYGGNSLDLDGQETTVFNTESSSEPTARATSNSERAEAAEIDIGVIQEATLEAGSVEWFVFEASAGDPITVGYNRETASGITGLILYGPDGGFKDNLYVGTDSSHALASTATEDGAHYLQVIDVVDGAGDYSFAAWLEDRADEINGGDDEDGTGDEPDDGDDGSDGDDGDDGSDGDDGDDSDDEFGELGYGDGPYGGIDS